MCWRIELEHCEVVYRLGGVDPERGVDAYDLVKYLTRFSDLVRETVRKSGYSGDIHIRVRPFREGSFLTEFIIEGGWIDLFSSRPVVALSTALGILGFCGVKAPSLPKVVKAVRGKIESYRDNKDGTYTYGSGPDAVTVDETTHEVVQSPKVADLYSHVAVGPIADFHGAVDQVNIYVRSDDPDDGLSDGVSFSCSDAQDYATYAHDADLADQADARESSTVTHNLWVRPVSGSYGGAERGYTFCYGEGDDASRLERVRIEDEGFLGKLESGEIRLNASDLMCVDLEIVQRLTKSGRKIRTERRILRVLDYRPYSISEQLSISDLIDPEDGS